MYTENEEVTKMRGIKDWPRWPWLPVKNYRDHQLYLGVIFADDIDGPVRVFDINIFQTSMSSAAALTMGIECPWPIHNTYESIEEMVADGWLGD